MTPVLYEGVTFRLVFEIVDIDVTDWCLRDN